jgi:hypothetical protein
METGLTKNQIITQLVRSPHGDLKQYLPVGAAAAKQEPEFFAHLISYDRVNGQVRDSKTALPVVSLSVGSYPADFVENSLAHLASLDPRNLVKAVRFAKAVKTPGRMRQIRRLVERYLRAREGSTAWFDRTAVQHRTSLKELYALGHTKPSPRANAILFEGQRPAGSIFEAVAQLGKMAPLEAAGTILQRKIPFLVAAGTLGSKMKEPDLIMALIAQMSPTELTTNMTMLEKLGVKQSPVLMAALNEALQKAGSSKKNTLKATRAAGSVKDATLRKKVQEVQEKQIAAAQGIEGNWLVLADKSGSMSHSIASGRFVAAALAKFVRGKVHLIFFDIQPRYMDATGMTYEDIVAASKHVTANGGTSIGCGLWALAERGFDIDGIAIVSDGGDNTPPFFHDVYGIYVRDTGKSVPVYLYHVPGEADALSSRMTACGFDLQKFELPSSVDMYSITNLVQTMRAQRYGLIDEIMSMPLLTLTEVFKDGN